MEKVVTVSHFKHNRNEALNREMVEELNKLVEAAGGEVLSSVVQIRQEIDSATYIGSGKAEEIAQLVDAVGAKLVVMNNELSGSQTRNLSEAVGADVIDRTALILDIFAQRATTRIAKYQVELAELKYKLPRLSGRGHTMSRLGGASAGGGIASRGLGEQKLELDKRVIRARIDELQEAISLLEKSRKTQRLLRERQGTPVVAVVGYTNAGKSTLMNRFMELSSSEKTVFEKDMLFATLDTFSRKVTLDQKKEFILIDTVGFVSNLPHALVAAFQSTLEEVLYADLLIQVVDGSNPNYLFQQQVTQEVLATLGAGDIPMIYAYNKSDLFLEPPVCKDPENSVYLSAKHNEGMERLIHMIRRHLFSDRIRCRFEIPFSDSAVASHLQKKYHALSLEYTESGTLLELEVGLEDYERYLAYVQETDRDAF